MTYPKTTGISEEQRGLMRHALGLPNQRSVSYRNRYFASQPSPEYQAWLDLEYKNFAQSFRDKDWFGDGVMFRVTHDGAKLVCEKVERLDREDFPHARI